MTRKPEFSLIAAPSSDEAALLGRAHAAARRSHSPYSKIRVGAALRTETGGIFDGTNVENSSYGLTICAERSAVAAAVAAGERNFDLLAVFSSDVDRIVPCGACLQVLAEFCTDLRILLEAGSGEVFEASLSALLPVTFTFEGGRTGEDRG